MSKFIHGGQVLLEEAQKAFDSGSQELGISYTKDCVEMLTNGLKRLQAAQPAEKPAKQTAEQAYYEAKQPSADHVSAEDAVKAEAERSAEKTTPAALALGETESKPGAGVVSEPAEQKSKAGAGVYSDPEKSQKEDGSGIA